jgi:hypothetical protein
VHEKMILAFKAFKQSVEVILPVPLDPQTGKRHVTCRLVAIACYFEDAVMDIGQEHNDTQPQASASKATSMRASSVPLHFDRRAVGYVYSTEMMAHVCLNGHPEQPERISRIFESIRDAKYLDKMKCIPIRPVKRSEALLVHSEDHWDKVLEIQREFPGSTLPVSEPFSR